MMAPIIFKNFPFVLLSILDFNVMDEKRFSPQTALDIFFNRNKKVESFSAAVVENKTDNNKVI